MTQRTALAVSAKTIEDNAKAIARLDKCGQIAEVTQRLGWWANRLTDTDYRKLEDRLNELINTRA